MLTEFQAYALTSILAVAAIAEWTFICFRLRNDARKFRTQRDSAPREVPA